MNYLKILSVEEINFICSSIPHIDVIKYFKKNPKEFSKIRPGFRPDAVTKKDAIRLLISNIKRDFISSFVEKTIKMWMIQIQDAYQSHIDDGKSETIALAHTLSRSYFSDNVATYFNLADKSYTDEQISLISDLIQDYKNTNQEIDDLNECIEQLKYTIRELELSAKENNTEIRKIQSKLQQALEELECAKELKFKYQKLLSNLECYKKNLIILENQTERQKERIEQLLTQVDIVTREKDKLECDIILRVENERKGKVYSNNREFTLLRPNDMEEFQENLYYIFEDLGISNSMPGIVLLRKYLAKILFCGIPIITSEQSGLSLAKCVANALIGTQEISFLRYSADISENDILDFMSDSKRVVLLDNFIGNYNETLLLPIVRMYGDKIIFMSTPYERTLNYVSFEFLKYCNYLNVSHINQLLVQTEIKEDPLTVNEEEYCIEISDKQSRHLKILNKILNELSLEHFKTSVRVHDISNDDDISEELIYSILPFCAYVCNKKPMNLSETLQKYIVKCPYNELIGEWFLNE